jgi:peptidoglycan hydrolase-like protein with peptidoglycan-binding domain
MLVKNWGRNVREALARSDRDFLLSDKMEETPSRFVGALRLVLQHPVELAGLAVMCGLGLAILTNALVLQNFNHASSPFLAQRAALSQGESMSTVPMPPQAPGGAERGVPVDQATQDAVSVLRDVQLALAERGLYDGLADGVLGPKTNAAIRSFQQHNGLAVDGQSTPQLLARIIASSAPVLSTEGAAPLAPVTQSDPIAALINGNSPAVASSQPDKRILGVERALAKQGYGPLKLDGVLGNDTRNAIARFEKDRGLPVTGQMSSRLLRELTLVTGAQVE